MMRRVQRALRGVEPGRLVIAMPWPADHERVRWYRDAVLPLLVGAPVCLLLGAPGRQARLLTGAAGTRNHFRIDRGPLDAALLAAVTRFADVFLSVGEPRRTGEGSTLLLAMAASGVPLVAPAAGDLLAHERDALLSDPGDGFAMVSTLQKLLSLPAQQRHYLGADFAEHALRTITWERAADAYAQRFAALVGRPAIPENLRAA
jgi:glycosyltransferase involved in cell wall biosynthesis